MIEKFWILVAWVVGVFIFLVALITLIASYDDPAASWISVIFIVLSFYIIPKTRKLFPQIFTREKHNATLKNVSISACKTCGDTVSKTASTCPHCGQRSPYKKPSSNIVARSLIIYAVVSAILVFGFKTTPVSTTSINSSTSASSSNSYELSARNDCEDMIKLSANNPSTLKIHSILGYASKKLPDQSWAITQEFSAKNSFGLEKKMVAYCKASSKGELENINIVERDY